MRPKKWRVISKHTDSFKSSVTLIFTLRLSAFSYVVDGISCYKPVLILIGTVLDNSTVPWAGQRKMVLGIVFLFGGSKSQCLGGTFI